MYTIFSGSSADHTAYLCLGSLRPSASQPSKLDQCNLYFDYFGSRFPSDVCVVGMPLCKRLG
uniref:Uncharacterized protein n=1 Tax=Romanomermis culicivorax TaxID=13658 RepID=A0A915HRQ2_ROMCU